MSLTSIRSSNSQRTSSIDSLSRKEINDKGSRGKIDNANALLKNLGDGSYTSGMFGHKIELPQLDNAQLNGLKNVLLAAHHMTKNNFTSSIDETLMRLLMANGIEPENMGETIQNIKILVSHRGNDEVHTKFPRRMDNIIKAIDKKLPNGTISANIDDIKNHAEDIAINIIQRHLEAPRNGSMKNVMINYV